ncbi:MAG: peptidoglycan-binding protein, partial [Candidatus Wildermuthbacteria bacterium]|nr:peptidoglycan-binding protein [Candidatus Wildermuthbacteria bacterium]
SATASFTHSTELAEGTWYFRVKAADAVSNESSYSSNGSVVVDTTAPSDGSISYSDGFTNSASVSLAVSDGTDSGSGIDNESRIAQKRSAVLSSGACGSYGAFSTISVSGTYPSFTHAASSGFCYQYQYLVSDLAGNLATFGGPNTIKIDTGNPTAPGTPSTSTPTADTTPSWSWSASADTVSGLTATPYTFQWSQSSSFASGVSSSTSDTASFTHSTELAEGTWYFRVKATDQAGNDSSYSSSGSVVVDTTSPVISGASATPSANGAVIAWTTSEASSSLVDYGLTSSYGVSTTEIDIAPGVTSHTVTLSSLVACTTYNYRVVSRDESQNQRTGSNAVFTTAGCVGSATVEAQSNATVSPSSGGSVTLPVGNKNAVVLSVEASSTPQEANFQIKQLEKAEVLSVAVLPAVSYQVIGSHVYSFSAAVSVSDSVTSFSRSVSVQMAYELAEIPAGVDEGSLRIYRWNGTAWAELSGCVTDRSARLVTCSTTQFSTFSLMGQLYSGSGLPPAAFQAPSIPAAGFSIQTDAVTQNRMAVLHLEGGSDAVNMSIDSSPDFAKAGQQAYQKSVSYDLCQGAAECLPGAYTVYARFYTSFGQPSSAVFARVVLEDATLAGISHVSQEEGSGFAALLARIQEITVKIEELRAQLRALESSRVLNRTLVQGMEGEAVRILQEALAEYPEIYPEGMITGYFGPLTRQAVQRFQLAHGIVASAQDSGYGIAGPKTRAVLNSL